MTYKKSLATMSCRCWPACGHLWLRPFSPFLLDEKGPKNQGRHQGPTALGDRSSPMSAGPARPTRLVFDKPCPIDGHETLLHLYYASPNSLIADPHSANAERDLLRPWDSLLVVALRLPLLRGCPKGGGLRGTKRSIYDRFAEDLFPN